ncbi:MAG: YjgN family protein [Serratia sp. (in: enterobacteria)]|uniref:YjgN family protein n=1 Tax=Serratia sp. (in: enterobacteria) TaxID=616 RepID=UPI003F3C5A0B
MENNSSNNNTQHQMHFRGTGGEYFAIWLVNILLTAITLGIYSAWATVRRRRYFYGNTELNGDRFDYHAQPMQILKGRLLVIGGVILFYILLFINPLLGMVAMLAFFALIPWIIIRSWRYNAIMSSYRGVRFNYLCQTGRAYWVLLFCPLLLVIGLYVVMIVLGLIGSNLGSPTAMIVLAVITVILFVPMLAAINGILATLQYDLYVNNLRFGNSPFVAQFKKAEFIKIALFSLLIFLPFLAIALVLVGSFFATLFQMALFGGMSDAAMQGLMVSHIGSLFMMMLVLLIGLMVSSSYMVVAQRNYIFNQTTLQGEVKLRSTMQTLPYMMLLITNSLITVFSLGLAAPVAHVRHARYMAQSTQVEGDLSLLTVQAHHDTANNAIAEEAVQALDLGTSF